MIRTEKLSRVFTTDEVETTALAAIDLEIEQGEFLAIMGPSGSGKSTLLNLLGLLDVPDGGAYYLFDQEVSRLSERQRTELRKRHMGFVFQSFNLIDELTVHENVELPLLYLGVGESERRQRVEALLKQVRMDHRATHFPLQLSGGQQQRVAVARAVAGKPALVLADEPTGNLDSAHGEDVMGLLREVNEAGATVVMVTHAPIWAAWSHRTLEMLDGHLGPTSVNPGVV